MGLKAPLELGMSGQLQKEGVSRFVQQRLSKDCRCGTAGDRCHTNPMGGGFVLLGWSPSWRTSAQVCIVQLRPFYGLSEGTTAYITVVGAEAMLIAGKRKQDFRYVKLNLDINTH